MQQVELARLVDLLRQFLLLFYVLGQLTEILFYKLLLIDMKNATPQNGSTQRGAASGSRGCSSVLRT